MAAAFTAGGWGRVRESLQEKESRRRPSRSTQSPSVRVVSASVRRRRLASSAASLPVAKSSSEGTKRAPQECPHSVVYKGSRMGPSFFVRELAHEYGAYAPALIG